jgi:BirA family biotin operon repressor/biotin-[acetyl-CoA-carboxylase] ligase
MLNERKLAGILVQSGGDALIAGIGLNVNQKEFPQELSGMATSLRLTCGREFRREDLLRAVLQHFERLYRTGRDDQFGSIPRLWAEHATMLGKPLEVRSNGSTLAGVALRIAPDGGLVISTGSGEQTLYAGDVTVRPGGKPNA